MPSRTHRSIARFRLAVLLVSVAGFGCAPALASSTDAWATFRKDVETACLAASVPLVKAPQIVVDPFGSESYGLAFLNGASVDGAATRSLVCIYDKATKRAEIGGTMALETAVPNLQPDMPQPSDAALLADTPAQTAAQKFATAAEVSLVVAEPAPAPAVPATARPATLKAEAADPAPNPAPDTTSKAAIALADRFLAPAAGSDPAPVEAPREMAALAPVPPPAANLFAGQCDATCALTLAGLAGADRSALEALAAEVERTVEKTGSASLASGPAAARTAALAAAKSADGEKSGTVAPPTAALAGDTSCTLYYYGYSGEAARTVARHRCAVTTAEDGSLVVEKTSGERLRAEIKPLTPEVAAFVGRTFEAGDKTVRYDRETPVDATNGELGNTVGFAAARDDGGLVLVSSQLRRFDDQGDFFWVLALDPK